MNSTNASALLRRITGPALLSIALLALAPAAPGRTHKLNMEEYRLFKRISKDPDQARRKMKLDPLLCRIARKRAREMAWKNNFSHIDPKGNGPNRRLIRAGYILPGSYERSKTSNGVESIVLTGGNYRTIHRLFQSSSSHRNHVFGKLKFYRQQKHIGVGIFRTRKQPRVRLCVFLSAHPNESKKPPRVVLLDPNDKVIASTRRRAAILPTL